MTKAEFIKLAREYSEVMPVWLKRAVCSDPIARQAVDRCLHAEVPASMLLDKVGEMFFTAYSETRQEVLKRYLEAHSFIPKL